MAEREEGYAQKRHPYPNRARSGPNRLYNNLGIRDLRELLDKKRSERGNAHDGHNIPPPDPSYNYLKDPLREAEETRIREAPSQPGSKQNNRKHHTRSHEHRNQPTDHPPQQSRNKNIVNPFNIKVEFSASTGEHSYKLDKETILPTIKHVPDQSNRNFRGRGRGRGAHRSYQSRTNRYHQSTARKSSDLPVVDPEEQTAGNSNKEDDADFVEDSEEITRENVQSSEGMGNVGENKEVASLEEQIEKINLKDTPKEEA